MASLAKEVPRLLLADDHAMLRDGLRAILNEAGFEVVGEVLNTADYGVPQTRKRTIAIGWKVDAIDAPSFPPKRTHANPDLGLKRTPWLTVRDAIADLPRRAVGTEIGTEWPLDLHFGRTPTEISLKRYAR